MSFHYETENEIEKVVRDFETCRTPKTEFKHRQHLTVAVWYLQTLSRNEALERLRAGLLRFLAHHGINQRKYSETITIFWLDRIAEHLSQTSANVSLLEQCNSVISSVSLQAHKQASRVAGEE